MNTDTLRHLILNLGIYSKADGFSSLGNLNKRLQSIETILYNYESVQSSNNTGLVNSNFNNVLESNIISEEDLRL